VHPYYLYIGGTPSCAPPFPGDPGRGSAQCGFIEPYRIAGLAAFNALKERGIEIGILFFDTE